MKGKDDLNVMDKVNKLQVTMKQIQASMIIVSNEVGMGIVPADPLSRRFRDLTGWANQRVAEAAGTVIFMVSGIPMFLKGAV
jgi:adenosylcobinamide kinase/adenosylcobinamide-phosphate guanylyltransferase